MQEDQLTDEFSCVDESAETIVDVFEAVQYWQNLIADGHVSLSSAYNEINARLEAGVLSVDQKEQLFDTYREHLLAWLDRFLP